MVERYDCVVPFHSEFKHVDAEYVHIYLNTTFVFFPMCEYIKLSTCKHLISILPFIKIHVCKTMSLISFKTRMSLINVGIVNK